MSEVGAKIKTRNLTSGTWSTDNKKQSQGRVSPKKTRIAGYTCGRFCLTLVSMGHSHQIAARVTPETKAKFRALAEQQQMTESALLKQLIELNAGAAGYRR